ncbi:MAG: NYN domain-containing protein [Chloroflexi bacterium]|nr:NYN domain-containing protein [Chloroflexota bacterium]
MSENGEVALFIDFENIRYGMKNNYAREPEPQMLMAKARKYGPVALANAYADFTEHPDIFRRKFEVAGISPRDIPRRSPDVAHKSSADMAMLMDIIDCLLDRPGVMTMMLMTGDSDFIRVVARARHRFGKKVIIAGVPGSVSNDLISAADGADPVVEADWTPIAPTEPTGFHFDATLAPIPDNRTFAGSTLTPQLSAAELSEIERRLIKLIEYLERSRPYLTFLFVKTHALSPNYNLNLTPMQVDHVLTQFKERGILSDEVKEQDGRTLRFLYFHRDHPEVQQILGASSPQPTTGVEPASS